MAVKQVWTGETGRIYMDWRADVDLSYKMWHLVNMGIS